MSRREMGPEELRAVKENLNKEGTQMEEGEEGGAAVYVGSKEEVTKARQLAETEGRAPDMASYIVMHKQVIATPQELMKYSPQTAKDFEKLPAVTAFIKMGGFVSNRVPTVLYKDSSGNFAKVEIDLEKIASLKSKFFKSGITITNELERFHIAQNELLNLGFKFNFDFKKLVGIEDVEKAMEFQRMKKIEAEQEKGSAF